jgi:tetratricopeptide (TPR) repeat protein
MSEQQTTTETLFNAGISALKAGEREKARTLLKQVVQAAPTNERAWLYLAGALTDATQQRYCLERVLALNPYNAAAQKGLDALNGRLSAPAVPPPATIAAPPVVHPEPKQQPQAASAAQAAAPLLPPSSMAAVEQAITAPPAPPAAPAAWTMPALPMLSARYDPDAAVEEEVQTLKPAFVAPSVAVAAPPSLGSVQPDYRPPLQAALVVERRPDRMVWSIVLLLGVILMLSSLGYMALLLRG